MAAASSPAQPVPITRGRPASSELVDRFVAAFNARDMKALVPILLDSVASEPQGVGGERGTRDPIWMNVPAPVRAERQVVDGVTVVAFTFETRPGRRLGGLERLEEVDGKISRIVNYYFCPETIALAAERLGLRPWSNGYHQDEKTLDRMIAQAELPWARGPR